MENTYINLNSQLNFYGEDRKIQFDKDKQAARAYFLEHVNQNTVFHHNLAEKLEYLTREGYYETEFLDKYDFDFIKSIFKQAYSHKYRFRTFVGAYKFYRQYALKTWDGKRYLERYEDRISVVALYLANGNREFAQDLVEEMITGRFQPATPTFLNAGRKQRGELVSCDLIEVADDMNSIGRAVNSLLQLSKRGAGVALNLTNLRSSGDPIKGIEGQASGVVPVMKILEDCIKYANQLGQRDGSAAVYLNLFHKDIEVFLDSRRENADDAIRINKLSLGVVIPDIFFELVKNNEDMYLFSPYNVSRKYGKDFAEVNLTEVYRELVDDNSIKKKKVRARSLFSRIAETQVESGYPYVMFEDNVNNQNPIAGKIKMSNLCSEILQVQTASVVEDNQSYSTLGKDISCNLASLNIDKVMEDAAGIRKTVDVAIRALTEVSDRSDVSSVPTIENGNNKSHAVGLGAMNLHGFLAKQGVEYGSEEALQFVDMYFEQITYFTLVASMNIAKERGQVFDDFENSDYYSGKFFEKYIDAEPREVSDNIAVMFPIKLDSNAWLKLSNMVHSYGLYNQNLQAVAPTGSISYINDSTASILPVTAKVETRKEGTMGQVYWPAPNMTNENVDLYKDGYEVGWKAIIDTYAAAQKHVDQGMSCTLFFGQDATTREINKAQVYAWKKGLKTLYYLRLKMNVMDGLSDQECVSCSV